MWNVPRAATSGLCPLAALALLSLLTLLAACGGPPTTTSGPLPGGAVSIVTRTASADSSVGADHHLSVAASCHLGEQMLAGGFAANNVFESDYSILGAYPSTDHTWIVSANSGSTYQLQALAYCLTNYPSLGIRALAASPCPSGSTLLTGGTNTVGTPYVLCAARGVTRTARGLLIGETELDCASGATGNSLSETRSFSYTCATVSVTPGAHSTP